MAEKGDVVRVSKSVMGRTYRAEGPVQATQWDRVHNCQLVQVQGDWWLETNDLENRFEVISARKRGQANQKPSQTPQASEYHGIMGIGGIGIYTENEMPVVPSERAIERVQRMMDTDVICRRCGASKNFDGAMFTTCAGGDICDDCF